MASGLLVQARLERRGSAIMGARVVESFTDDGGLRYCLHAGDSILFVHVQAPNTETREWGGGDVSGVVRDDPKKTGKNDVIQERPMTHPKV